MLERAVILFETDYRTYSIYNWFYVHLLTYYP